ncbi:unnamed protein product [Periconia digitata]|uniref:UBC core domain-containing protein n=1 Tax=Periconia digitata TaxID=1303443 RepID=A0A9W4XLS0_9PLEO|nr:unnamed protein product [Periconia digitata]
MAATLRKRLLDDIRDVQNNPYPNTHLHVHDEDITRACLILDPEQYQVLHLTIKFSEYYPIFAPEISIQTEIEHPNVFGDYICATMLNTAEDWTPAYTLRGIIIQMLSFFMSESVEQEHWMGPDHHGEQVDIWSYRDPCSLDDRPAFQCKTCGFVEWSEEYPIPEPKPMETVSSNTASTSKRQSKIFELPDEVIIHLMSFMDATDLVALSGAIPSISHMLRSYDVLRIQDLNCFVLKKSLMDTKLGIGVSVTGGRRPVFRSEFDLLSNEAYNLHGIRTSVQGVPFDRWLPLPLSRRHWEKVRLNTFHSLTGLRTLANLPSKDNVSVLYHFMNTIVVQFSATADNSLKKPSARSTLSHASEKAVESYYALFHILLCIAIEDPTVVPSADKTITSFLNGPRTKKEFPDLGHVLVAALISTKGVTQPLIMAIIKEAILRNVVWMLDSKGAGMAELAYMEPNEGSRYRLYMTFYASKTSYRLLMFLRLFFSMAKTPGKSLVQLRDELFDSHGAPPHGITASMMPQINKIHAVASFPEFLSYMGVQDLPTAAQFSAFLKRTIGESVKMGYSAVPMTQSQLYLIRRQHDVDVEKSKDVVVTKELEQWFTRGEMWYDNGWTGRPSFFPQKKERDALGGGRGGRGGRGRGRGRGRGG